jgi:predicted Fe-Mo cluster-binding NifX family protein
LKLAVTASGPEENSEVDARFGRAPYLIVADVDTGRLTVVDNLESRDLEQGAGIQAAQKVIDHGAKAVITGHCGPKAFRALSAAGVAVYPGAEGTVAHMLEKYARGELKKAEGADVLEQW